MAGGLARGGRAPHRQLPMPERRDLPPRFIEPQLSLLVKAPRRALAGRTSSNMTAIASTRGFDRGEGAPPDADRARLD